LASMTLCPGRIDDFLLIFAAPCEIEVGGAQCC